MRTLSFIIGAVVLLGMFALAPASAQTAIPCDSTHTITAGDWLSKLADKAYGNPLEYFPIYSATNSQAISDPSFHFIDDPDLLEVGWKVCIPVKPVAPAGLSPQELQNTAYKSEFGADGVAQLTNGNYSAPAAPGSAMMNTVSLGDEIAYGDVNGTPSAAVVLVESGGGSGVFSTLHLVQAKDGKATDIALSALGDRINLTSLYVQDNKIVVGMTTQGPGEPMCCGTQRVQNTYALNGDRLAQVSSRVVGKVGEAAGAGAPGELTGVVWKWTNTLYNDGKAVTPIDPNRYLIEFLAGGSVSVLADCNRIGGTYQTDGNQLTITLGPSTLVACPPDSQADEFTKQLGQVSSYLFDGDKLVLEFKFDSGTMTFAPSAPTGLAGTAWDVVSYNNGKQAVVTLVPGTSIWLNFGDDGGIGGSAGCNAYGGAYEADGDKLEIRDVVSTMMYCETPAGIMDQEQQYLAALQNAATFEIAGGTLTIRDAGGGIQVVGKVRKSASLTDGVWKVIHYNNGKQAVTTLIAGTEITLNFGADGNVSGSAGCNTYSGSYETSGDTLRIGPLASTKMACTSPEGVMEQEMLYLAALQKAATYEIAGSTLTIRDADGATLVVATR